MEEIESVLTSEGLIIKYLYEKLDKGYSIFVNQEEIDYLFELLKRNGYKLDKLTIEELYKLHSAKLTTENEHIYIRDNKIYPTHSFGDLDLALTNYNYVDAENAELIDSIIDESLKDKPKRVVNIKCDITDEARNITTQAIDMYLDLIAKEKDLRGLKELRESLIKDVASLLTVDETLRVASVSRFPLAKSNYMAITRPFEADFKDIKSDVDISFPKKRLTIYDKISGKCYYFKD